MWWKSQIVKDGATTKWFHTWQSEGNWRESDIHSRTKKEVIFYRQIQTRICTDTRQDRQTDRQTDRCFNETCNCCVIHYDHSVWPASKDEGWAWTHTDPHDWTHMHTHTHTHTNTPMHTAWVSLCLRKRIVQRIWWLWGPCWLWLKGTPPSVQNNVAPMG